jgi:omega-amidase
MKISIIQASLHWQDKTKNLQLFAEKLLPLKGETDIIVLPEMFTTGFSMQAETLAETMDGTTFQWMKTQANFLQSVVVGSFICIENNQYFNRLIWMQPDGIYHLYDKRHLFSLASEDKYFTAGTRRKIIEYKGFRFCPLVCYDLRFPVWSRNDNAYDVLIYVANWPVPRVHHWDALLHARAIENQAFTIGVNIFGEDGNGLKYSGHSSVYDYAGTLLHQICDREDIATIELSLEALNAYRNRFGFLKDQDTFEIII